MKWKISLSHNYHNIKRLKTTYSTSSNKQRSTVRGWSIVEVEFKGSTTREIPLVANPLDSTIIASKCANVVTWVGLVKSFAGI